MVWGGGEEKQMAISIRQRGPHAFNNKGCKGGSFTLHAHLLAALQICLDSRHFGYLLLQLPPQSLHFKFLLLQLE